MQYAEMTSQQLAEERSKAEAEFAQMKKLNLKLDMSRGKPGADQLDLSMDMLKEIIGVCDCKAENGFDCRNYGVLEGLPECRALFAEILEVPAENVIVGGASSLNLMFDYIAQCVTKGVGGEAPWAKQGDIKFICNVPGYDRHFTICEHFGIEMLNVEMTENGPDVEKIRELVKDPLVKGMFCVPKYSNPEGKTFSDEVVKRIAALKPAAKDFRVMWDNAYCVHHISENHDELLNIFPLCRENNNSDMVIEFTSTSKITFPGAGVAALAASDNNIAMIKKRMSMQTIGYDKLNQLRHARYFKNIHGMVEHMKKHADIMRPKFDIVLNTFEKELAGLGIGSWLAPRGGYFISFDSMDGCAKAIVAKAKEAGLIMTPAGATFPYGKDPHDSNIRIAPSYPTVEELKLATEIFVLSVKLVSIEKLLAAK